MRTHYQQHTINLDLHPDAWMDSSEGSTGDVETRARMHYRGGITINGVGFHVTALRVVPDERATGEEAILGPNMFYAYDRSDAYVRDDERGLNILDSPDTGAALHKIGDCYYTLFLLPYQR